MAKAMIDLDSDQLSKAREILGTSTITETVDAALTQVISSAAQAGFVELAASGAFAELVDPEVERGMWS